MPEKICRKGRRGHVGFKVDGFRVESSNLGATSRFMGEFLKIGDPNIVPK